MAKRSIKKSEKKLADANTDINQQKLVESISENISEGIYRSFPGKGFAYVNRAFLDMFGFSSLEKLNAGPASRLYAFKSDLTKVRTLLQKHGYCKNVEVQYRRKDKSLFWASLSARSTKDQDGNEIIDGAIRDITAQKEAERKLLDSQNFFENIINAVPAPIYVKDESHRLVLCNESYLEWFGKSSEEMVGRIALEYLPASRQDHRLYRKRDEEVLRFGKTTAIEESFYSKDGQRQDVISVRCRFVNNKNEKFLIGTEMDVTELKRKEHQLSLVNAQLKAIMNSTKDSIFAVDKNFRYIAFNNNHQKMSRKLQHADIEVGDNLLEILKSTGDDKWLKKGFTRAFRGEAHVIEKILDYPGYRNKAHSFSFNPIMNGRSEVTGAAIYIRDVSEYVAIQRALTESHAHLQAVLESTRDQVFSVDLEKRYIAFNSSHKNAMLTLGETIEVGEPVTKYFKDNNLRKKALAIFRKAIKGTATTEVFEIRSADYSKLYFEGTGYPITGKDGKIAGIAAFFRNVTKYKEIEKVLRELNDELAKQNDELAKREDTLKVTLKELSDRNFELDQLMYKTSHDLRSPLSSILGLVNLSKLDPEPANKSLYLSKVEDRIKRLDSFIKSMLNYAKVNRGEIEVKRIYFNAMIETIMQSVEYHDNYQHVKSSRNIKGDYAFYSDPVFTNIILSNIISNAFKYYDSTKESYLMIDILVGRSKVDILIKDNGIGIREKYMSKIFNMFFRGTDKLEGSGLGMYIVKQAVERLSGKIQLKSKFGQGTEVRVSLPNLKSR